LSLDDRNSLADLDNFVIATSDGNHVPLREVAYFEEGRGYARINRYQRSRTITIQGDVDRFVANANAIISDTTKRFLPELQKQYPMIDIELGGQNEEGTKTQQSMVSGFLVGMIGVFFLLCFQFRSYVEPLVVMIVIPLSFIGVIFGHLALGIDFTLPSILGFIAMAGVVVNNSILLVNFVKDHQDEYPDINHAAPQAARARFRAIFITTLTTVAGMLPLLVETSLQAQVLIPMVASLTFGLITSVFMVLFVVPALYAILDDFNLTSLSKPKELL
jgi:hydrophobic/amphiphilic exporter-1 (mainly G- bacteria), HAE1 family